MPPQIVQQFSSALLSNPMKFNDDLDLFARIHFYINNKLMKKAKYNAIWEERCDKLEKEFLELYERAKVKEKESKKAYKNKTQEPFYRISFDNKSDENIFAGFRIASYRTANQYRESNKI